MVGDDLLMQFQVDLLGMPRRPRWPRPPPSAPPTRPACYRLERGRGPPRTGSRTALGPTMVQARATSTPILEEAVTRSSTGSRRRRHAGPLESVPGSPARTSQYVAGSSTRPAKTLQARRPRRMSAAISFSCALLTPCARRTSPEPSSAAPNMPSCSVRSRATRSLARARGRRHVRRPLASASLTISPGPRRARARATSPPSARGGSTSPARCRSRRSPRPARSLPPGRLRSR